MMPQKDIDKKGRDMPDFSKYANSNEKTKGSHKSVNAKILAKGYTKGLYRSERFLYLYINICTYFARKFGTIILIICHKGKVASV